MLTYQLLIMCFWRDFFFFFYKFFKTWLRLKTKESSVWCGWECIFLIRLHNETGVSSSTGASQPGQVSASTSPVLDEKGNIFKTQGSMKSETVSRKALDKVLFDLLYNRPLALSCFLSSFLFRVCICNSTALLHLISWFILLEYATLIMVFSIYASSFAQYTQPVTQYQSPYWVQAMYHQLHFCLQTCLGPGNKMIRCMNFSLAILHQKRVEVDKPRSFSIYPSRPHSFLAIFPAWLLTNGLQVPLPLSIHQRLSSSPTLMNLTQALAYHRM